MGMKFACLTSLLVLIGLGLISCGNTNTTTATSGTGLLFVTTQGNQSISVWGINLTTGVITTNGNAVSTGNMPAAVATSGSAVFVANKQDNTISSYTINSDGTLAAASGNAVTAGTTPVGLAVDPAGKFLYVANEGDFADPASGTISVFGIQAATLTASSSISTATPGVLTGTGPVSVAVTANGNYLYVANQFTNTVSGYAVNSGALTLVPGSPYPTGTTPSSLILSPDGNFVFVTNAGSNNISAFAACTSATLSCVTPDGHLTAVHGSPFASGLAPVSMAIESDAQGEYLYVADYNSSQISEFKVGTQSGVLTALSTPAISTGANPTAVVVRAGSGTLLSTGGTSYYVFTSNATAGTISSFTYDSTTGSLGLIGSGTPTTTAGQPSAMAVR
jgi:DNA-binding beta-propeller fold protein YncE